MIVSAGSVVQQSLHEKSFSDWDRNKDGKIFKPEFVLISAGFDGHISDPLAQLKLETEDFYIITKRILESSKK